MKSSAKGRYGLQFMIGLAREAHRGPHLVEAVAAREGLPPKFIRVLLGPLKAAGLVKVQRGPSGGCALARDPARITALEVLEALEGRLGGAAPDPGAAPSAQAIREVWLGGVEAAREVLAAATLAGLVQRSRSLQPGPPDYAI